MRYPEATPNSTHIALAKLKAVVTQNIHSLHQAAGLIDYFRGTNIKLEKFIFAKIITQ